jgi:signal transduction histidine kinase
VVDRFTADESLTALAVDCGAGELALVDRFTFIATFARPFGRDLFERKPIAVLMERRPLVVDGATTLAAVSAVISDTNPDALSTGFIVTAQGRYLGMGTGLDLMRLMAEQASVTLEELKATQRHLVEAEKFASLGQLVAGVAHEINTPLGIALTAASALDDRTRELVGGMSSGQLRAAELVDYLDLATETVSMVAANLTRAAGLIRSFKQVAVDQSAEILEAFPLRRVIEDTLASMMGVVRDAGHQVVVECDEAIEMTSYPGPLSQVLTNLIGNALTHAFADRTGGTITIRAIAGDRTVTVIHSDDGAGIPAANLPKIWEPFFTTRRGKGGSGLGLHIVHNIVTQSLGGRVEARSSEGQGASFTLELPREIEQGFGRRSGAGLMAAVRPLRELSA